MKFASATSDHAIVASFPALPSVFTHVYRFKLTSTPASGTEWEIVSKASQFRHAGVINQGSGTRLVGYGGGSGAVVGSTTLSAGIWYTASVTSDGSNLRAYLNGILDNTNATDFGADSAGQLWLGGLSGSATRYGDFTLSHALVYNRGLTAAEQFALYALGPSLHDLFYGGAFPRQRVNTTGGGTNFSLSVNAGSYAITGSAATLTAARALSIAAGAYVITGSAATVLASRAISATTGAYAITGIDANLAKGRQLSVAAGSYAITGSDASLIAARAMSAASGAYVIVGSSANLAHVIPGTASTQGMGPGWNLFHPEVKREKRSTIDEIEAEIRQLIDKAQNAESKPGLKRAVHELKETVRDIAASPPPQLTAFAADLNALLQAQTSAVALMNAISAALEKVRAQEQDDMEALSILVHLA